MAATTATPTQTPTLALVNMAVIDCRLGSIYRNLAKQEIDKTIHIINDTIKSINNAIEWDCESKFVNYVLSELYLTLISIAFGRIHDAHNKIRDLHYKIEDQFIP